MAETVSLKEAATRLGKSEKSVRRYLKQGWLEGQLIRTPSGERWLVTLPADGVVHPPETVAVARHDAAPQGADLAPLYALLTTIAERQEHILGELTALREETEERATPGRPNNLTPRKVVSPESREAEPPRRRWRWPWQR